MKLAAKRGRALALSLAAFMAALLFIPCKTVLTVREYQSGRLLWSCPVQAGESFSIRYTHSVNLSDVTDSLEWTGEELILRSSLFTAFGAGIPVLADGIGREMKNTPQGFLISGIDKPQEGASVPIMLQEVPDHRLLYRGSEIKLREISPDAAFIRLSIERLALWRSVIL